MGEFAPVELFITTIGDPLHAPQLCNFSYGKAFVLILSGIFRATFVNKLRRGGKVKGRQAQVQGRHPPRDTARQE